MPIDMPLIWVTIIFDQSFVVSVTKRTTFFVKASGNDKHLNRRLRKK